MPATDLPISRFPQLRYRQITPGEFSLSELLMHTAIVLTFSDKVAST